MKRTIFFITMILLPNLLIGQWALTGNGGTSSITDFVGPTDAQPLNIKTSFTTTPQPINFYY